MMGAIMRGEATQAQIGGFLVALRFKGETADEIAGCAEAMREHVLAVKPKREDLVDTAGTGGDDAHTLNISTAAALVAAAAGAGVAKHGNRAVSSSSGSADVLEALGFELDLPPERIEQSIDELGFGFLFAPTHHPAMKHAAPVRRELATRTVFNVLGPLTNPAGARAQVVGVYAPRSRADDRRRARAARRAPRVRRARRRRDRRALARRPEPRRRGRARPGASSGRSTRSSSASRAATRRSCAAARRRRTPRDPRRVRRRATAARATRSCSTQPARSPRAATRRTCARGIEVARDGDRLSGAAGERLDALVALLARRSVAREFARRPARAGARRDRGVQAALAVGGRPAAGRRPGGARPSRSRAPARRRSRCSSTSASAARSRICKRAHAPRRTRRCSRRASSRGAANCCSSSSPARTPRCCSCATSTTTRARADRPYASRAAARDARRGARRGGARPRGRARRAGDRRQRARPLDVPDRPACAARARRACAARPRRRSPSRDRVARAGRRGRARRRGRVLVGSTLMRATDPAAKLRELLARPLVKVCGLTREEDVAVAVEAGADLAGFILAKESPRRAKRVLDVPDTMLSVAVFVEDVTRRRRRSRAALRARERPPRARRRAAPRRRARRRR